MQFGVCGDPQIAVSAADAGYDFFEWSVGGLLKPLQDNSDFHQALELVEAAPLSCPVVNVFLPGTLKVTGPTVNQEALLIYVRNACRRAEEAGVQVIVFGSGGARQVPEGFPYHSAWNQLVEFCRLLGPIASEHGVTIAIEPLNRKECNIINSLGEAIALAKQVNHPGIQVLVDSYHWAKENGSTEDILAAGPLLAHVHIATYNNRRAPTAEDCDFAPFFSALRQSGYGGRISIEGHLENPATELPTALSLMKGYLNDN